MILLILIAVALCLAVLATCCRRGHPGLARLRGWSYAHRGLHGPDIPENSMAAFRLALEKGYGIELDVHLMRDGGLAVIHDASLKRTSDSDVTIESLTAQDLPAHFLEGTEQTIPLFRDVLDLFQEKAPMIIELKSEGGNHAALCRAVCDMLENYRGDYCIESFDPRCVLWLRRHRPQVIRGQLTRNFFKADQKLPWIIKLLVTHQLLNFLTRPDFVAYRFEDRKTPSNFLARKLWGAQGVAWTLRDPAEHRQAVEEGWIPIFEYFQP